MQQRVAFFIDGFNLFHSLKSCAPDCRWLNLRKLCQCFLRESRGEVLSDIFYFSAIATWSSDSKVLKHRHYIERLKRENIRIILGKFKEKDKFCPLCKNTFKSHEEKRTDVNIALKMVSEAVLNHYDTAVLVSGDTDMIPAFETIRELGLNKRLGVLFPLQRKNNELESCADFSYKITRKALEQSLFEAESSPEGWIPLGIGN